MKFKLAKVDDKFKIFKNLRNLAGTNLIVEQAHSVVISNILKNYREIAYKERGLGKKAKIIEEKLIINGVITKNAYWDAGLIKYSFKAD